MTYSSTGLIQATDYNTRVWGTSDGTPSTSTTCLYRSYGPGYGAKGVGQSMTSMTAAQINPAYGELYPVTAGTDKTHPGTQISAVQWTGMISAINILKYHQISSNLTLAGVHPGSQISTITALDAALSSIESGMGAGRIGSVVSGTTFNDGWSFTSIASVQTKTVSRSFSFQSPDQARYFFNGGGRLRINITATDNTAGGTPRSAAMASLIQALGSCDIDSNGVRNTGFTGTGVTSGGAVGKGYWQGGPNNSVTNYVTLGTITGDVGGTYTDDSVTCGVYFGGSQGSNGDNGDTLYVKFTFSSGYGATGTTGLTPSWQTDSMNITINTHIDAYPPSTSVLANSWGSFSQQ